MKKYIGELTKDIIEIIHFVRWDGEPVPSMDTPLEKKAGRYCFRTQRDLKAWVQRLNQEHGEGTARAEI